MVESGFEAMCWKYLGKMRLGADVAGQNEGEPEAPSFALLCSLPQKVVLLFRLCFDHVLPIVGVKEELAAAAVGDELDESLGRATERC